AARPGARLHRRTPGRLRHRHRRARDHALRRAAPAARNCPRADHGAAHPDPGRRDGLGGRDHPGPHQARTARGDERADDDHHPPPPVDDLTRGRADRARQRTRRGPRHRRGAAAHERRVPRHPRARAARGGVRAPRRGDRGGGNRMRVWQPGGHLTRNRDAVKIDDWSWQRTVKRVTTLARLAAPYKRQTTLAIVTLLAATATALAPPYLAKLAIDDGIAKDDVHALTIIVALFLVVGVLNLGTSSAQTYVTGWTGERILADLRNTLFRHLQRLSLGFYERNRAGVIISRLTNDVEALDQLV